MDEPAATWNIEPGQYLNKSVLEALLVTLTPGPDTDSASSIYLRSGEIEPFMGAASRYAQGGAAH